MLENSRRRSDGYQSYLTELNYGMRSTDIDNLSLDC